MKLWTMFDFFFNLLNFKRRFRRLVFSNIQTNNTMKLLTKLCSHSEQETGNSFIMISLQIGLLRSFFVVKYDVKAHEATQKKILERS